MNINDKITRLMLSVLATLGIVTGVTATIATSGVVGPVSVYASPPPQPDLDGACPNSPNPQPDLDDLDGTITLVTCLVLPTSTATP
jgi:hypothetical protein